MRQLPLIFVLAIGSFAAETPSVHVSNFGTVNAHLLRGGEPSPEGITELGSAGVQVIIDLRERGKATDFEKQQAERLGMTYANVPFPPLSAPSASQVRTVLNLLAQHESQTVFLHCRRGKDRTGTVIACYRIQHDGWDNDRALREAREFGMSVTERGMRSFILRFTPASNPVGPLLLAY